MSDDSPDGALTKLPNGTDDPELPAELAEVFKTPQQMRAFLSVVSQITVQSTSGHYPPPAMMAEYAKIDPKINQQILSEAKAQGEHRRDLEQLATKRSEDRQDKALIFQQWVSYFGLLAAVAIVALALALVKAVSWPVAAIAILLGAIAVGGRPAATIVSALIAGRIGTD